MTLSADAAHNQSSPADLRAALAEANIPILLMVLVSLTGDESWLDEPFRPSHAAGPGDNDSGGLSEAVQQQVRDAAGQAVLDYRAGKLAPRVLDGQKLARMLSVALAEEIPPAYGPLLAEEFGDNGREMPVLPTGLADSDFRVLIIGCGVAGICAAVALRAAGIAYTIIEKNADIGGTWLENVYPGCGVDTPSHLYSFSFAPNPHWSRYFAKRDEIADYLRRVVAENDVIDNVVFGAEVIRADYREDLQVWEVVVRTAAGEDHLFSANAVISAVGVLNRPAVPPIPGLDEFSGPVMHTAEYRADVDMRGRRVAVIGTGASAMQLVPTIAGDAAEVVIFQRSKQWAIPHPNYKRAVPDGVHVLMREVPLYAEWYRLRQLWLFSDRLHEQLQRDPDWPHPERSINAINDRHRAFLTRYITTELDGREDLVDACVPDYPPYGKRPLIDNGWYRTITRDDVHLVTEGVAKIGQNTLVTTSGAEYTADVIILATGFRTLQFLWPMQIQGRSGSSLADVWGHDDARAHLGISVPDFPNLFILNGPNTTAGHGGSAILSIEFQTRYVVQALCRMIADGIGSVEIRNDVFADYVAEVDATLERMIWVHPGMSTYYRNSEGRVVVTSPWKYLEYWRRTREFDLADYRVMPAADHDRREATG